MDKEKKLKKIKWGVAGCGKYAEQTFIPALSILRKSTLNSIYSGNVSRAKQVAEKFGVQNYFNDYDSFLNSDINAVYISSVNSDHYEQVIKAAKAGKNILCEKPLAISSEQAGEMVQICRDNGVLLAVNYVHRFYPLVTKAKEFIDSQMLGKITSITLNFNIDIPPSDNFRFKPNQAGGGALRDLGTHLIDLLRYFGGEFKIIGGALDNIIYNSDVEDFATAIVKFDNTGYGYFSVSYNNRKAFNRIEILGHKGALCIDNLIGKKNVSSKLTILHEGELKIAFRKRGNKLLYLLKSVQNSFLKREEPLITGQDGLINLQIMEELENKCRT